MLTENPYACECPDIDVVFETSKCTESDFLVIDGILGMFY
uniref:Uncharacterized protein n=1 Tax=Arundo donax TaxID=35708 RepID=A0A0A9C2B1_ARUDO